jgi:hypothetical protein
MNGAFSSNSSESLVTVPAHCSISNLPTSVEPVNVSLRTVGLEVSSPPISVRWPGDAGKDTLRHASAQGQSGFD